MLNFQAVLLIARGDPKGYEEKEALEREVNCLESYLEGLPSLCVLAYLKRVSPEFLDSLGLFSFYRPFYQICFTMTLFLKSGPCFILPKNLDIAIALPSFASLFLDIDLYLYQYLPLDQQVEVSA